MSAWFLDSELSTCSVVVELAKDAIQVPSTDSAVNIHV